MSRARLPHAWAFALAVAAAEPASAVTVEKAFVPEAVLPGASSKLTLTFTTAPGEGGRSDVRVVDVLPDGLVIAFGGTGGTCVNAAAATTATPTTSTISIFNLQVSAGPSVCVVTVPVQIQPGRSNYSCDALPPDFTNDQSRVTLTNASSAIAPSCLRTPNPIFANGFE